MTHEAPSPEADQMPKGDPFNIQAMSDDQLKVLGRALYEAAEAAHEEGNEAEVRLSDSLWNTLASGMAGLIRDNPNRGRWLLDALARSDDGRDQEFAATATPIVAEVDYELARDTVLYIDHNWVNGDVGSMATGAINRFEEHITPEQAADFRARLGRHA